MASRINIRLASSGGLHPSVGWPGQAKGDVAEFSISGMDEMSLALDMSPPGDLARETCSR